MTQDAPQTAQRSDRWLRLGFAGLCGLVALSAVWGAFDGFAGQPRVWGFFGFECVTLLAAALGVLIGIGRLREAPALGAACVAGAVFAAATLGRFSAIGTRTEELLSEGQIASRLVRDPVFEGRAVAAGLMLALAVLLALGRDQKSWKKLGLGLAFGLPALFVTGWLLGPGKSWLLGGETAGGSMVRVLVGVVGGVALTLCAGVAVHLSIRAFELRMPEPPLPARRPAKTGAKPGAGKAGARKSRAASPKKSA